MTDFGRYVLTYEPPTDPEGPELYTTMCHSVSGEATLPELISFMDAFLKASGYIYEGELGVVNKGDNE